MRYRNIGPDYHRSATEVIPRGAEFDASPREHARFQRRRSTLFQVVGTGAALTDGVRILPKVAAVPTAPTLGVPEPASAPTSTVAPTTPVTTDTRWKLKMSPAMYLELHPEGPKAALAREILGRPAPTGKAPRRPKT